MQAAETLDAILKMNNRGQELCERHAMMGKELQALYQKTEKYSGPDFDPNNLSAEESDTFLSLMNKTITLEAEYNRLGDKMASMSRYQ